ncbi:protocadherin gamma-A4-like, partial [Alosa alosa]|uniref:protocadherin gamma-A4-like n=1 Tax=Alosa alosa TaxID=278164 RepID=UPI0020153167
FPKFRETEQHFDIAEHTIAGTRFQVQGAQDPDLGSNSVRFYKLNQNDQFDIETRERHEEKIPFIVLKKALDRETQSTHRLVLTAIDGGNPPKSGTLNITVTVLDSNDNRPVFSQETYAVDLKENVPVGTTVIKIKATDLDEGSNGEIEFALGRNLNPRVYEVFQLDSITGEIRVKGKVDYENTQIYKLDVEASDKGQPPLTVESGLIIKIIDVNDNTPDIDVTSVSNIVSEDSKPGTFISLISVTDKDSGDNGKVMCSLPDNVPFELKPSFKNNMYSLVTKGQLDREVTSHYELIITATDFGQPPLSSLKL